MVRLVNGTGPYEGRVEIYLDGMWKTLCGHPWMNYDSEAKVVCAQLGYPREGIIITLIFEGILKSNNIMRRCDDPK